MKEIDRYLEHATRGLWGKARRDARLELRGAIEDKIYRFRLLGMADAAATQAALRDLGSPHAIARGLSSLHSLPQAMRAALLASAATLLGVQALAQVPTVRAIPERRASGCDTIRLLPVPGLNQQDHAQREAALKAKCRQSAVTRSDLLSVGDIIAALKASGVQARLSGSFLVLDFPGVATPQFIPVRGSLQVVDGQPYLSKWTLPGNLMHNLSGDVPLRLEGQVNPVLHIGPARLQLGTRTNPVHATELYTQLLLGELPNRLAADTPPDLDLKVTPVLGRGFGESFHWQLGVTAPDGALYVTLNNAQRVSPLPGILHDAAAFELSVGQVRQGLVPVPMTVMDDRGQPLRVRVAHTPTDFFAATRRGEAAFLVYRLEPGRDLRRPGLTLVSPAQVQITSPEVP